MILYPYPRLLIVLLPVAISSPGCSLLSKKTGDAELVFAATEVGTPEGDKVTKDIGPAGGTLTSPDGRMTLTVPPNAVAQSTSFSIQPITNKAGGGLGLAYRLQPDGKTFDVPLQLTVHYDEKDLEGTFAEVLSLAYQDAERAWHGQRIVKFDPADKTLTFSTMHFTDEAMIPGIRISPTKATVYVGGEDLFISLAMFHCTDPGFWDRLLSRPRDCTPTNIHVNRDWTLKGPGKIQFATKPARPDSFNDPISGQLYTPPASKPTQKFASVEVTTSAQMWNPATGEMFAGPRSFNMQITILDRGYKASGESHDMVYSGDVCDLEKPFTVKGTGLANLDLKFTPTTPTSGTVSYTTAYNVPGMRVNESSSGTYILASDGGNGFDISLDLSGTAHTSRGDFAGDGGVTIHLTAMAPNEGGGGE